MESMTQMKTRMGMFFSADDCQLSTPTVSVDQHPEANFNFKSFCDAFANLGQYPDGCPSATPSLPTGSLVRLLRDNFTDVDNEPSQIESTQSDLVSIRVDGNYAYWSFKNSYVIKQFDFSATAGDECETACEGDSLCVAAYAYKFGSGNSFECSTFHYSDTLTTPWEGFCGADSNGLTAAGSCEGSIGDSFRLFALNPGTL
ncbi:hypothetical protein [Vibrio fortis]|uniref:hypothetical protein n=1 Tax=Vibrio fortis TaxID=212667 RepID=UPI0038CD0F41